MTPGARLSVTVSIASFDGIGRAAAMTISAVVLMALALTAGVRAVAGVSFLAGVRRKMDVEQWTGGRGFGRQ